MKNIKRLYEKLMLTIIAFALVGIFIQNQYSINYTADYQFTKSQSVKSPSQFINNKDVVDDIDVNWFRCRQHKSYYTLDHFFDAH